jgi:archaellum biogenesis protein FlaJ (TadC family)
MARTSGSGLLLAGTILTFVGLCIVLVRVWHVPVYWVPLMAGVGLLLMGLVRRLTARDSRGDSLGTRDAR